LVAVELVTAGEASTVAADALPLTAMDEASPESGPAPEAARPDWDLTLAADMDMCLERCSPGAEESRSPVPAAWRGSRLAAVRTDRSKSKPPSSDLSVIQDVAVCSLMMPRAT
jgi:hypothetical protein